MLSIKSWKFIWEKSIWCWVKHEKCKKNKIIKLICQKWQIKSKIYFRNKWQVKVSMHVLSLEKYFFLKKYLIKCKNIIVISKSDKLKNK